MKYLKSILQRLYPYGICRKGQAVYLTFDDGPIPEVTPKVLEILDRYGVKATFFMVGENIDKHPEVFAQVLKAGHSIGNHTYNHMKGWKVSNRTYMENVAKWEEAVQRNCPKDTPAPILNLFRPPYGRTWVWQRRAVAKLGYRIYLWDVLTRDYNPRRTPEAMLAQIKRCTRPGSIINFHDSVKSNERMLATLPKAIEWLLAQGYKLKTLVSVFLLAFVIAGCANRGIGPQGGPKDTTPPSPQGSVPEMGALNFSGKRIEVTFDEYIQLDNIAQNLLMSPPQQTPPDVKVRGKRLIVQLQDSLRDSTTYTLNFGAAVCDYRERVPLHNYTFYFSTGPTIDTLEYTGRVFDAATLNPMEGIYVGIHESMEDSAFTKTTFLRVARTDTAGFFRIGNMHAGSYRLYAVEEVSRDYRLSPGEALAFANEPIEPVQSDSATLMLFREEQQRLYLQRTIRDRQHCIQIYFSSTPDSLPELKPLTDSLNYFTSYSPKHDTLTIWLTDSFSIAQDSLFIEARYRRTDSLYRLEWYTDTLRAIWRAPRLNARAKALEERKNKYRRLELKTNARNGFELYDTLRLHCATPIASIKQDSIRLFEQVDTIFKPMKFTIAPYDTLPMQITFLAEFKPEGKYELRIDSGAIYDIYGVTHIKGIYSLQVKSLSDYSTLRVKLNPYLPKARIQVLNNKDKVIRELPADPEGAYFQYLKPDTYYMRLYLDENGDGKWTTGSWSEKRQPEPIYYFPEKIQTKSNWDFEEEWDYQAVEQLKAKPKELILAAPKKK